MTATSRRKPEDGGLWFRPWIPALLVGLIAATAIAVYAGLVYLEPRLLETATAALRNTSGRDVVVEGFRLSLPVRIDRVAIAGDGEIDTRPLLELRGVSAWPDIASLLRFTPRVGLLQAESAVLRLREEGGNWSTRGAFTQPADEVPAVANIALPNLRVLVEMRGEAYERLLRVNLDLLHRGSFTGFFHGDEAHGRVHFTGEGPGSRYRLDLSLDRLPRQFREAERMTLTGDYHVDSQLVDFAADGSLLGRASRLSGRVRFDTSRVQTETAAWSWGAQSGRLLVSYDHRRNRRIDVLSVGRVTLPLPLGSFDAGPLSSGTLHLDRLGLTGSLTGPWQVQASVVGEDLEARSGLELAGGHLEGDVTLDIGPDRAVSLVRSRARVRFTRARAAGFTAENADFALSATPRSLTVSGRARALGGAIEARDVMVTVDGENKPTAIRGHIELENLSGDEISDLLGPVSIRRITGNYDVEAEKGRAGWRLVRADGFTDRVEGGYRGEPFAVSQAHVIARGQPGEKGSVFSFNGYVRVFEGRGRLRAEIEGRDLVDAWMEVHDVDLAAANRVLRNPRLEAISRHVDKVSMAGRLRFASNPEDAESGFTFDGSINSSGLGIEVSSEAAFPGETDTTAVVDTRAGDAPAPTPVDWTEEEAAAGGGGDEAGGEPEERSRRGTKSASAPYQDAALSTAMDLVSIFRLDGLPMQVRARGRMRVGGDRDPLRMSALELAIDTDRTVLSIDEATLDDSQLQARILVKRIDAEHLRLFARHLAPNPLTESLPLRGSLRGDISLRRDPESFDADLSLEGDLMLRGSPLSFYAVGQLHELGPGQRNGDTFFIINVDTIGLNALHQSLADLNIGMERSTMHWDGDAGVSLILTDRWDSIVTAGKATLRNASVQFPADSITASGINGDITFRIRKGRLTRSDSLDVGRAITCERLRYNDVVIDRIHTLARFNEKSLLMESMTFSLAGGRGTGGFTIDFPRWDEPRTAFFGRIRDCNLETVYRQMQPFAGNLSGLASAEIELQMNQEEFQKLEIRGTSRNGVISTNLLTPVIEKMDSGIMRNALESLVVWQYDSASFQARYRPNTYSPFDADGLFLDPRKTSEVVLAVSIKGNVYPFNRAQILHLPTPFARIGIPLELQSPNMPLRLTMYRVGRRIGR